MSSASTTIFRHDYTPPAWLVEQVKLNFELDPEATEVSSSLQLRRNPGVEKQPLLLDGEGLELLDIQLDGETLPGESYLLEPDSLTILDVPDICHLEIRVRINPAANTALEGLYVSSGNFCTQCEAQGFRHITYFPDRPDVLSRFTTTITANKKDYPQLLSNGNPVSHEELSGGRHRATWSDPFPKPCYLFALVAGDLAEIRDTFTTCSGREVEIRFYVEHHHKDKVDHAIQSLKRSMAWDEEQFGREYDLDIYMVVAVDDFNMGAMENKGLNVFNSKYVLASPDTATDADFQAIEEVIAHEYFHNWTGNRITCRDWFQLSLKEGLTVFRDQEFSADQVHRDIKRIEDVRLLRNNQFSEDAGPMAHPVRPDSYEQINNFYTMTVYHKGAEVIRMYQTLLGREGFRRGMDLYFERHDGQAVTCDDFLAAMADANDRELTQFSRWYSQSGTPQLDVTGEFDPTSNRYTLQVSQSCPATPGQAAKEPFHIPLRLALLDRDGAEMALQPKGEAGGGATEVVLDITKADQSFVFTDLKQPIPSLLRGFSAPVKLSYPYHEDELAFLLAHDRDPFGRWEAGQQLATRVLLRMTEELLDGKTPVVDQELVEAFGQALTDRQSDPALRSQLLTLPGESYLAEQLHQSDPGAIHIARQTLRQALAEALEQELRQLYEQSAGSGPYRCTPDEAGRRSLRNLCLGYLLELNRPELSNLAIRQYQEADNMTDQIAALKALVDSEVTERDQLLDHFHSRWQSEPLVIDKWFTLQATSQREDVLQQVLQLADHADFTLKNPNRCRALLNAFAHANPAGFHHHSGDGYRFIADKVLELDRLNPQIAARLVSCFNRWKRLEPVRGGLMQQELKRIQATGKLSRDVAEIVNKAL